MAREEGAYFPDSTVLIMLHLVIHLYSHHKQPNSSNTHKHLGQPLSLSYRIGTLTTFCTHLFLKSFQKYLRYSCYFNQIQGCRIAKNDPHLRWIISCIQSSTHKLQMKTFTSISSSNTCISFCSKFIAICTKAEIYQHYIEPPCLQKQKEARGILISYTQHLELFMGLLFL